MHVNTNPVELILKNETPLLQMCNLTQLKCSWRVVVINVKVTVNALPSLIVSTCVFRK